MEFQNLPRWRAQRGRQKLNFPGSPRNPGNHDLCFVVKEARALPGALSLNLT